MKRKNIFNTCHYCAIALLCAASALSSCAGKNKATNDLPDSMPDTMKESVDTVVPQLPPQPGDEDYKFESYDDMRHYLDTCADASKYAVGIIPIIAAEVPQYAEKLIANQYDRFIIVDKASMEVQLYDKYGRLEKDYGMACAKNYGTKHKKADSRTPEGFFTVEGRYNSTEWLFTDDNGVQSKKKGQFGPRFIRLKIPTTTQIGIHGTCSPWSIGHRVSHGCIRILNENILELVELVEPGMPVIVLPGKRDRAVNRQEGYDIPYFHTHAKYAMSDAERKELPRTQEEIEAEKALKEAEEAEAAAKAFQDSIDKANAVQPEHTVCPEPTQPAEPAPSHRPDSIN